jgi:hypothetical protein
VLDNCKLRYYYADEDAVVHYLLKACIGDLAASLVEARRAEHNVQNLPLARRS